MIEARFGLRRRPFPPSPDHACYYPATAHEYALSRLLDGLNDGEGILLLTSAPGLGKTLLAHCLLDRAGARPGDGGVDAVFLTGTLAKDRAGLLQAILFDLSLPHQGRSEQEMRLALIDHLLGRYSTGARFILVIDEAQHLSVEQIEELRMLGNLEGQSGKALQVLLIGQPELLDTLARPELVSFRQRIAVRAMLEPLAIDEAADYILHHVRIAGGRPEELFDQESLETLARASGGVPRVLNQCAQQALRMAAEADSASVDVEVVLGVLEMFGLSAGEEAEGECEEPIRLLDRSA